MSIFCEIFSVLSRLLNVLLGGVADMTLSARAFAQPLPRTMAVIDFIFGFFGDEGHCERWYWEDVRRAKLVISGNLIHRTDDVPE